MIETRPLTDVLAEMEYQARRKLTQEELAIITHMREREERHERGEHLVAFTGQTSEGREVLGCWFCSFRTLGDRVGFDRFSIRSQWLDAEAMKRAA